MGSDPHSGVGRDQILDAPFGGNDRTVVATAEELADFGVGGAGQASSQIHRQHARLGGCTRSLVGAQVLRRQAESLADRLLDIGHPDNPDAVPLQPHELFAGHGRGDSALGGERPVLEGVHGTLQFADVVLEPSGHELDGLIGHVDFEQCAKALDDQAARRRVWRFNPTHQA